MDEIYTTQALAAFLHLQPQTIRKWRMTGLGPRYIRLGPTLRGRVLYRAEEVSKWLQSKTFRHSSEEIVESSIRST